MSTEVYEYDGTENGLEGLLAWWSRLNTDNYNYGLEGGNCATGHADRDRCLYVNFVDEIAGTSTPMHAGDKVFYGDDKFWLERA